MAKNWTYVSGDWNLICDVCSLKIKASQSKERWDGFRVCPQCFEQRQPLDFVRARADKISVPFVRPIPPDVFVVINLAQAVPDALNIVEFIQTTADYFRYIGRIDYGTDSDLVNGSMINLLTINSTSADPPPVLNEEAVTLSESVIAAKGFFETLSDSITLSETISEGEGEFPSDSFSFSETILYINTTNKLINAHLVNEVILG